MKRRIIILNVLFILFSVINLYAENIKICFIQENGTKIEKYLKKLSINQRKIVKLLSDGYKTKENKKILHMNNKEYSENLAAIQAYENVKILM